MGRRRPAAHAVDLLVYAPLGMLLEATADGLVSAAETAMRQAERLGGGRVEIYDPENEATHHT